MLRIRIRDPVPVRPLDPGPGREKKSGSGSGMNNPDEQSESLEATFRVQILKFFDAVLESGMERIRIRDGKNSDRGSGMEKVRIRDKHHGSATLPI